MGLLRADQARDSTGLRNIDLFKQWAAKGWANLNGSGTVALRDSRNIASIVDNGVGDYTLNYTSLMSSANGAGMSNGLLSTGDRKYGFTSLSTSAARLFTTFVNAGSDSTDVYFTINGDLA